MRIVHWPKVVKTLFNPTMRPGLPVLGRSVSQIVGDIKLVSVRRTFGQLCRRRGSSTCSGFLHKHISTTERENSVGEASLRSKCGGKPGDVQQHKSCDASELWRSATVQCMRHVGRCSKKEAKQFVVYFQTALVQEEPLPAMHSGVECISCDLGDHAHAALLFSFASGDGEGLEHGPGFIATLDGQRSELGRSLLPFIATPGGEHEPFRDAMAVTVPRLRRCHQMGAAIGWLQRNSGHSSEGRGS